MTYFMVTKILTGLIPTRHPNYGHPCVKTMSFMFWNLESKKSILIIKKEFKVRDFYIIIINSASCFVKPVAKVWHFIVST